MRYSFGKARLGEFAQYPQPCMTLWNAVQGGIVLLKMQLGPYQADGAAVPRGRHSRGHQVHPTRWQLLGHIRLDVAQNECLGLVVHGRGVVVVVGGGGGGGGSHGRTRKDNKEEAMPLSAQCVCVWIGFCHFLSRRERSQIYQ